MVFGSEASPLPEAGTADFLPPEEIIFGTLPALQELRETSYQVATSNVAVLITGETGTGKEVLARQVHLKSPWRKAPFFKVNCPALQVSVAALDPLADAVTSSAAPSTPGLTGAVPAGGATLLLNEIALLDPGLQLRLLEKLREGPLVRVERPGGGVLDLRLISVTSRRLEEEVESGAFIRELYQLLNVVCLHVPPLRSRREDIPRFVQYFLDFYNQKFHASAPFPTPQIMRRMGDYRWPGNIRELRNLMMRYVLQGAESAFADELGARRPHPPPLTISLQDPIPLKKVARQAVQEFERKIIRKVLEEHHWNRKQTARALNISYRALLYKIKDAGVPPKRTIRPG